MELKCSKCGTELLVDESLGGRPAKCGSCDHEFMIPISDPQKLFNWVKASPWDEVHAFVINSGASGHDPKTMEEFNKVVERRRWKEEHLIRKKLKGKSALMTDHERAIWKADKIARQESAMSELASMKIYQIEDRIVEGFRQLGYHANRNPRRDGVNVEIWDEKRDLWAVVQCKKCAIGTKVSDRDIRAFAGAFALSGAVRGFFFTTGCLSKPARQTAGRFDWLRTFAAKGTLKFISGKTKSI